MRILSSSSHEKLKQKKSRVPVIQTDGAPETRTQRVDGAFFVIVGVEMDKKRDIRKEKRQGGGPGAEESSELGMIRDRLSAQNPEGESFDRYLGSLRETLAARPDLAVGLLESLSRNPSAVGFKTFGMLRGLFEDKAYRRAVKQAAYRFAQKGFADEADVQPAQKIVLIPKEVKKGIAHFLISHSTFWFLSALMPDEKYPAPTLLSAFVEEDYRRVHVTASEGSNRFYREFLEHAESHFETKPCEIPLWHAANLLFEMLSFSNTAERSGEVDAAKRLLKPYHDPERRPFVYELLPELHQPFERMTEADIGELLRSLSLLWYLLPKAETQPFWERILQLDSSVLVISKEIREERSMELLRQAAREMFTAERRRRYRLLFEEQALYFRLTGKENLAKWCWIVVHQLKSEMPAEEIPVLIQLVLLTIKFLWPKEFEGAEKGAEESRQTPEKRTESGLILL